jgi:hypothetical protein
MLMGTLRKDRICGGKVEGEEGGLLHSFEVVMIGELRNLFRQMRQQPMALFDAVPHQGVVGLVMYIRFYHSNNPSSGFFNHIMASYLVSKRVNNDIFMPQVHKVSCKKNDNLLNIFSL